VLWWAWRTVTGKWEEVSCATLRLQQLCAWALVTLDLWLCQRGFKELFFLMIQGWSTMPSTPNLLSLQPLIQFQRSSLECRIKINPKINQRTFSKHTQIIMSFRLVSHFSPQLRQMQHGFLFYWIYYLENLRSFICCPTSCFLSSQHQFIWEMQ